MIQCSRPRGMGWWAAPGPRHASVAILEYKLHFGLGRSNVMGPLPQRRWSYSCCAPTGKPAYVHVLSIPCL
jgi:hypothetical protein